MPHQHVERRSHNRLHHNVLRILRGRLENASHGGLAPGGKVCRRPGGRICRPLKKRAFGNRAAEGPAG